MDSKQSSLQHTGDIMAYTAPLDYDSLHESISVRGLVDRKIRVLPILDNRTLLTTLKRRKKAEHVTMTTGRTGTTV